MWWPTPETLPSETVCKSLKIPNDANIVASVIGAISELAMVENWESAGVITPAEISERMLEMLTEFQQSECEEPVETIYPVRADLNPALMLWSMASGTLSFFQSTMPYGVFPLQSAAADLDSFKGNFSLAAGNYVLEMWYSRSTSNGKIDVYIDGVQVVSQEDLFIGVASGVRKLYNVNVLTSGNHLIQCIANGKNASSAGYQMRVASFSLWQ